MSGRADGEIKGMRGKSMCDIKGFIYSLCGVGVDGEVGIEEPYCGIRGVESAERVDTDSRRRFLTVWCLFCN